MKFCRFYSFDSIVQCKCGYIVRYDIESTLYLKCPLCGEVLIDRDVEDKHLVPKKSWKNFQNVVDNDSRGEYNDSLSDGNNSSAPSDIVLFECVNPDN